ncbi:MAG: hypothetical protein EBR86_07345 [Planctomycetia bacterium]|nr:hypothetical protein [Planctomycetia bacterium]
MAGLWPAPRSPRWCRSSRSSRPAAEGRVPWRDRPRRRGPRRRPPRSRSPRPTRRPRGAPWPP